MDGENSSTRRKPPICRKSMVNLSHNVISRTPHLSGIRAHNVSGDRHWLHKLLSIQLSYDQNHDGYYDRTNAIYHDGSTTLHNTDALALDQVEYLLKWSELMMTRYVYKGITRSCYRMKWHTCA